MSDSPSPTDGADFNEALAELIERTYRNGNDPEGGYKVTVDGNGDYFWDVQITTVQYDGGDGQ